MSESQITVDVSDLNEDWQQLMSAKSTAALAVLNKTINGQVDGGAWTGWYDYPSKHGFQWAQEITQHYLQLRGRYDCVVLIGVGGSYLGTAAAHEVLTPYQPQHSQDHPQLMVLGHHLSAEYYAEFFEKLAGRAPLVVVVSKSGSTLEPSMAFQLMEAYMQKRYGAEAVERIIAVTDASKGVLREKVKEQGYKAYSIPEDVGGRYSVMTPVGLVPLAFLGVDIEALLKGADAVFTDLKAAGPEHDMIRYATCRSVAHEKNYCTDAFLYNHAKLFNLVEWWKQLFGESEGKEQKGLLPVGVRLTTDLHSLGQYLQEGKPNILGSFFRVIESPAAHLTVRNQEGREVSLHHINALAMQATKQAYVEAGMPCIQVSIPELNTYTLGQVFAFYEAACAVSAGLLGVNAYNQPGVEAYKSHLKKLMHD